MIGTDDERKSAKFMLSARLDGDDNDNDDNDDDFLLFYLNLKKICRTFFSVEYWIYSWPCEKHGSDVFHPIFYDIKNIFIANRCVLDVYQP